ncbi:protocadherin gamma-B1-like isoform X27 [Rana temporaria]|uniref:protocadherin gamma-B1-like isoform X27 n=1 Tax=Rana temporaria TaxID=8407 RepID=UPI001AACFF87|nr:protocadherin gamma-B1-like isoform X27 [Rana temporaria]
MDYNTGYRRTQRAMAWQVFIVIYFLISTIYGQLQYSIPEELKKGSVVGNVAKDLGLNVKEFPVRKFQVIAQQEKQYLNVDLKNGDLFVSENIDREALCGAKQSCILNLEAVIEKPLNFYTVTIEIQDVNDNSPIFSKTYFDIEISELTSPGVHFALGIAKDPDLGTNSVQTYTLTSSEYFSLGEKHTNDGIMYPEIILEKPLDRERQSSYEFILTAFDGGLPPKSGTAIIKIDVQDVNDNYPVFSQDKYNILLHENAPLDFVVISLNATDNDEGSNSQITYAFSHISEKAQQIFSIDSLNGDIKISGTLDYETSESYEMTVEAKDGGGHVTHCKISIQVIDINDNVPLITVTSLSSTIPEDSPPGTVIALIKVQDLDSGMNGEVSCQSSNTLFFQLIPTSSSYYKLVTAASMDRELHSIYNITVHCVDTGSPPLTSNKTIPLAISDVNDNPPVFEKRLYIFYIPENNQPGTSILNVRAVDQDRDENGKITYNILNSNIEEIPVSSYMSINSMTGVLYAQRSFDYEQLREFQFQVMAKDSGTPALSSNVTVRVCIIDRNDNSPKILYPSVDTEESGLFEFIPHTAEKGFLVTKVIAVDAVSGHNAWLSYHLLQVSEPSLIAIGQQTGEIRIGRDLPDKESFRQKIVILVKDNGIPSLSSTVTLNLVMAENFQQVVPEIRRQPNTSQTSSNLSFYLVIAIALISMLFIVTVMATLIFKCRKANPQTDLGVYNRNVYPQFTLGCPSEISDTSLPFPFSYDVCVTLDSKQNEIAFLKPVQNVPTDNLIDTGDPSTADISKESSEAISCKQQAQPNADWRISQAQRPGPSGAQPTEEAGVWPNNQFETERLQAMILASANEAAEGTSGLGGSTGTMGLSARYGPQFTLQHVPDYRQNVYIPGSTLTPTNAAGKRDGKGGGNKKKSGKKDKK